MRMSRRIGALAAIAGLALVAGCGSSSDTASTTAAETRAAAPGTARICPPAGRAGYGVDVPATVRNDLAIPVQLWFDDIDCGAWWGKTPAYYSGAILAPGASMQMPVGVWSRGAPEWNTRIRSQNGADVYSGFRQILTSGTRIDILIGNDHSRENTVAIKGAGKPAIARMRAGNTLALAYAK